MTIIRFASGDQIKKLSSAVTVQELLSRSYSCCGECWDCDNCGGSATH